VVFPPETATLPVLIGQLAKLEVRQT
jgi:hypothetical protein